MHVSVVHQRDQVLKNLCKATQHWSDGATKAQQCEGQPNFKVRNDTISLSNFDAPLFFHRQIRQTPCCARSVKGTFASQNCAQPRNGVVLWNASLNRKQTQDSAHHPFQLSFAVKSSSEFVLGLTLLATAFSFTSSTTMMEQSWMSANHNSHLKKQSNELACQIPVLFLQDIKQQVSKTLLRRRPHRSQYRHGDQASDFLWFRAKNVVLKRDGTIIQTVCVATTTTRHSVPAVEILSLVRDSTDDNFCTRELVAAHALDRIKFTTVPYYHCDCHPP